jgi:hypothetical protein
MNLYAAYFVPTVLDPYGKCKSGECQIKIITVGTEAASNLKYRSANGSEVSAEGVSALDVITEIAKGMIPKAIENRMRGMVTALGYMWTVDVKLESEVKYQRRDCECCETWFWIICTKRNWGPWGAAKKENVESDWYEGSTLDLATSFTVSEDFVQAVIRATNNVISGAEDQFTEQYYSDKLATKLGCTLVQ